MHWLGCQLSLHTWFSIVSHRCSCYNLRLGPSRYSSVNSVFFFKFREMCSRNLKKNGLGGKRFLHQVFGSIETSSRFCFYVCGSPVSLLGHWNIEPECGNQKLFGLTFCIHLAFLYIQYSSKVVKMVLFFNVNGFYLLTRLYSLNIINT